MDDIRRVLQLGKPLPIDLQRRQPAQGEHKMARALLPVQTTSAHWLAHPTFADAVERFLEREGEGIAGYMDELERRNPFRQTPPDSSQALNCF